MLTIAFQIFYNDDYRQGDEFMFYDLSRKGQCVANCVVLKANYEICEFRNWSKHELQYVLYGGDLLNQKLKDQDNKIPCIPHAFLVNSDNSVLKYHISKT